MQLNTKMQREASTDAPKATVEKNVPSKKKLKMVVCAKGGSGKSIFTFLYCEKHPSVIPIDMDSETPTTSSTLAYREPAMYNFKDKDSGVIDRATFDEIFNDLFGGSGDSELIADLGAAESGQFIEFLKDVSGFPELLETQGVELEVFCIVAGGDMFRTTTDYCKSLLKVSEGVKVTIVGNEYYTFEEEQRVALAKIASIGKCKLVYFNLVRNSSGKTQDALKLVIESGKGITAAPIMTRLYFNDSLKNFSL